MLHTVGTVMGIYFVADAVATAEFEAVAAEVELRNGHQRAAGTFILHEILLNEVRHLGTWNKDTF